MNLEAVYYGQFNRITEAYKKSKQSILNMAREQNIPNSSLSFALKELDKRYEKTINELKATYREINESLVNVLQN